MRDCVLFSTAFSLYCRPRPVVAPENLIGRRNPGIFDRGWIASRAMNASVFPPILSLFCDTFRGRAVLQLELLALRQQLATVKRTSPRPLLRSADRLLWVTLSRILPNWRELVVIVKPEIVIGWHCKGFRLLWSWKLRRRRNRRPTVSREVRDLIHRMSRESPFRGAPRVHGELLKVGIEVSQSTGPST